MSEGSRPRDVATTVTASASVVSAASRRIARGLADLMGDPSGDEMPPELAALVAALGKADTGAASAEEALPA